MVDLDRVYKILKRMEEIEHLPIRKLGNAREYNHLFYELEHTPISPVELIELHKIIDKTNKEEREKEFRLIRIRQREREAQIALRLG